MSDDEAPDTEADEPPADDIWARATAPQTPYSMRQVGIGLVVFVILAIVAFALPLALA